MKMIDNSRLKTDIAVLRDYLQQNQVQKLTWVEHLSQLVDSLNKSSASSSKLVNTLRGKYLLKKPQKKKKDKKSLTKKKKRKEKNPQQKKAFEILICKYILQYSINIIVFMCPL